MKRLFALLVALTVLVSVFLIPTAGEETSAETVGYASSRVVKKEKLEQVTNILAFDEHPTETAYKITTPEGLCRLAELVDNFVTFAGVTVYLANDLNMEAVTDFKPIGNEVVKGLNANNPDCYFAGTFDGQGHVIENLKMTSNSDAADVKDNFVVVALFGVNKNMTVRNLIMGAGCSFTYTGSSPNACVAAISARLYGADNLIDNCYVLSTVSNEKDFGAAIICRLTGSATVTNTTNAGSVTVKGGHAAGFLAYGGNLTARNCRNAGNIKGNYYAAGIGARLRDSATIENCINNGAITGEFCGGIVSRFEMKYTLRDCVNYGVLSGLHPDAFIAFTNSYDGADAVAENNRDETGKEDPTLSLETIVPDYTPMQDAQPDERPDGGDDKPNPTPGSDTGTTAPPPTPDKPNETGTSGSESSGTGGADGTGETGETGEKTPDASESKGCKSGIDVMMLPLCGVWIALSLIHGKRRKA